LIFKTNVAEFYSDDDKAVLANQSDLVAAGKRCEADLKAIDASIANNDATYPNREDQIETILAGEEVKRPEPLSTQRITIQHRIHDIEQALDFIAGKVRQVNYEAGARLAKDIKAEHDVAENELTTAMVVVYEKHLAYWKDKRSLLNKGIGLYGLFSSNIDDVLGIPVDRNTPLADFFREQVHAGNLKRLPKDLS
jgi:hypothetical protein